MAKRGRKPSVPDEFFIEHPRMPYDKAIQVLTSYGVTQEINKRYYYKRMAANIGVKRGRKSKISDELFMENYRITDPEKMATVLDCGTAYAKNRMMGLGMTIDEKESELEEVIEQESAEPELDCTELQKCGRKPRLADRFFLNNPSITDPEEMAKTIRKSYRRSCNITYARKRMEALGMTIEEKELVEEKVPEIEEPTKKEESNHRWRTPNIPKKFFEENPNMGYDNAKEILKTEYNVSVTRSAYYQRRSRLKDEIPEIKMIKVKTSLINRPSKPPEPEPKKKADKRCIIPDEFFEDYPDLAYEDAIRILKQKYDIMPERRVYSHKRSGFMQRVLRTRPSNASDSIEDLFFNRTLSMSIGDIIKYAKQDYNIDMTREDAVYRRVFNIVRRQERDSSVMDKFRSKDHIVNLEELTEAIQMSVKMGKSAMEHEAAQELANHLLNFFGSEWRIIDNVLTPNDRDAFYMLEDVGLLTTERDETTLYDGRAWRTHYWVLDIDKIVQLTTPQPEAAVNELEKEIEFYLKELPAEAWNRDFSTESTELTS